MFGSLDISTSGLVAQRTRLEVTVLAPGDPSTGNDQGVHVQEILLDGSPFRKVYDPGHPNADSQGYVNFPNVHSAMEMVNALEASRAYEANITAAEATKAMMQASLRLLA
jgi:flagellar basal-body rod protein FlgC